MTDASTPKPSFSTCFWGDQNKGLEVLLVRMKQGKHLSEEIHAMLKERSSMEEDYGKRLSKLAKTFNPKDELGTLRESLDIVRTELERSARAHLDLANELRIKLEKPLQEFITSQSALRKNHSRILEKHLSNKAAQEAYVTKHKERYETRSLEVSQLHLMTRQPLAAKEAEKVRIKHEKMFALSKQSEQDYRSGVDKYGDIHRIWQADMTAACLEYQKMEEDRFQFIRGNIWNYTNFISGMCVADDEGCERIRVSLEKCDFEKDLSLFIERNSTGSYIPKPMQYIPFMDGRDLNGTVEGNAKSTFVTPEYVPSLQPNSNNSSTTNRPSSILGVLSNISASFTSARHSSTHSSNPNVSTGAQYFRSDKPTSASTNDCTTNALYESGPVGSDNGLPHARYGSSSNASLNLPPSVPIYDPAAAAYDNPHTQLAHMQIDERGKDTHGNGVPGLLSDTTPGNPFLHMGGVPVLSGGLGPTHGDQSFHYNPFDVPESVQVLFSVRALYDYDSGSPEELTVLKGQVIPVIATHEDGWWEGLGSDDGRRRKGLFPSNFTETVS
ncbi:hypothetical protein BATDEDRAFT_33239 [Batrachochytrium dendrobatidis JAM81]|uniref:F-BAR domain-containing protein n=2 Tax=Batrachochytrium dendrobatidis TaxID=109871 RepID=F4P3D9_BATDJ|nr:uncharacterized protein BATDEDRAFT_33239 [Batrachochytrium dendrobatidis JAM81]EGF80174.1 hypothetical protein BATDEDRAFT_33239 [Batrachochytrium dendrobatidis JAM81]OAJ41137.1 hypothetical protein BDEG_24781 [Batrachochytrium dendrobatidis JEL423]|eukprot:XP_006679084.1 hypothetical protein BATDEDRAFT_33239 [Batrachochytrium dendrobatidis JAM81]